MSIKWTTNITYLYRNIVTMWRHVCKCVNYFKEVSRQNQITCQWVKLITEGTVET